MMMNVELRYILHIYSARSWRAAERNVGVNVLLYQVEIILTFEKSWLTPIAGACALK